MLRGTCSTALPAAAAGASPTRFLLERTESRPLHRSEPRFAPTSPDLLWTRKSGQFVPRTVHSRRKPARLGAHPFEWLKVRDPRRTGHCAPWSPPADSTGEPPPRHRRLAGAPRGDRSGRARRSPCRMQPPCRTHADHELHLRHGTDRGMPRAGSEDRGHRWWRRAERCHHLLGRGLHARLGSGGCGRDAGRRFDLPREVVVLRRLRTRPRRPSVSALLATSARNACRT